MQGNRSGRPSLLVVDDERDVADTYAQLLRREYDVRVAYGGEAALEALQEAPADVVLLDRRMPDLSGDQVLVTIRNWGLDTRVALVTAVDPSFDVLGLGFDDYLLKPVGIETLRDTVERLLAIESYDSLWKELSQLRVCRNVLRAEHPAEHLEANPDYRALLDCIETLEARETTHRESVDRIPRVAPVRH